MIKTNMSVEHVRFQAAHMFPIPCDTPLVSKILYFQILCIKVVLFDFYDYALFITLAPRLSTAYNWNQSTYSISTPSSWSCLLSSHPWSKKLQIPIKLYTYHPELTAELLIAHPYTHVQAMISLISEQCKIPYEEAVIVLCGSTTSQVTRTLSLMNVLFNI